MGPCITSHIHNWALFSLLLCLFILSGVISPLFSNSILGSYWPGEFVFQCHIFLPFHSVHGVLKARILEWFAIAFSSGPHSEEALQIAVKRIEVQSKGEKERHIHLNAEFQRIAKRDKKAFLRDQCNEIEVNNTIGRTRELLRKLEVPRGYFMQRWAQ